MEPIHYAGNSFVEHQLEGSLAMSARPDAPVLPVRRSRRRRLAVLLRSRTHLTNNRRQAVHHRPVRGHPSPIGR